MCGSLVLPAQNPFGRKCRNIFYPTLGMEDKNDQIAQLRTEIQQKDLAASQCAQNAYLIQQLRPAAVPAFNVPNPYAGCGYGCYCNQSVA